MAWLEDNLPTYEYLRKTALATSHEKVRRGRDSTPSFLLVWYNTHTHWRRTFTIQENGEHHHFFHPDTNLGQVLVIRTPILAKFWSSGHQSWPSTWPNSGPFCRQNPWSELNYKALWLCKKNPDFIFLFNRLVYLFPTAMSFVTENHTMDLFYLLKGNFKNLLFDSLTKWRTFENLLPSYSFSRKWRFRRISSNLLRDI